MLDTYCTRCHQPGGQGAGDFTDDSVALALAERMRVRVEANEMPPPAADPECRDYHGSERMVLPDSEKQKLADWLNEAGIPNKRRPEWNRNQVDRLLKWYAEQSQRV